MLHPYKRAALTIAVLAFVMASMSANVAEASSYAKCSHKRTHHREIVLETVHAWYDGTVNPERLLDLAQAEVGIGTCVLGKRDYPRLHLATFPRRLAPEDFPALLLANELVWAGLLPEPTEGLVGEIFLVSPQSLGRGAK